MGAIQYESLAGLRWAGVDAYLTLMGIGGHLAASKPGAHRLKTVERFDPRSGVGVLLLMRIRAMLQVCFLRFSVMVFG